MNRRLDHLTKAWDALGQAIEHLKRAGDTDCELDMARKLETFVLDLIADEPLGKDTDAAYEESIA